MYQEAGNHWQVAEYTFYALACSTGSATPGRDGPAHAPTVRLLVRNRFPVPQGVGAGGPTMLRGVTGPESGLDISNRSSNPGPRIGENRARPGARGAAQLLPADVPAPLPQPRARVPHPRPAVTDSRPAPALPRPPASSKHTKIT